VIVRVFLIGGAALIVDFKHLKAATTEKKSWPKIQHQNLIQVSRGEQLEKLITSCYILA